MNPAIWGYTLNIGILLLVKNISVQANYDNKTNYGLEFQCPNTNSLKKDCKQDAIEGTYICMDIIPAVLDNATTKISIVCMQQILTDTTFIGTGWNGVKTLHLSARERIVFNKNCFVGLSNLRELKISIFIPKILNPENVFEGLDSLETLDLSDSLWFTYSDLLSSLRKATILPNLRRLLLVRTGNLEGNYELGQEFWNILRRNITELNLSGMKVSTADVSFLADLGQSLEIVNISDLYINTLKMYIGRNVLGNLREIDLSSKFNNENSYPINYCIYSNFLSNIVNMHIDIITPWAILFSNADTVYFDHFCTSQMTSFRVRNIRNITFGKPEDAIRFKWKSWLMRGNNMPYLDAEIVFNVGFESVDISSNNIEFITPGLLSSLTSLKKLYLNDNRLNKMNTINKTIFETLFTALYNLDELNLANNDLDHLPSEIFANNSLLVNLDISRNRLTQITFRVNHLKYLNVLDLRNNQFKSVDVLSSLQKGSMYFDGNPFKCSSCSDKISIVYLVSVKEANPKTFISCTDSLGRNETISCAVVSKLQDTCNAEKYRKNIIIISITLPVTVSALIGVLCIRSYKRRKIEKIRAKRENAIALLQAEDRNTFAAYLVFSSDDNLFVKNNVLTPLENTLQHIVGTDRKLVCVGDAEFYVGYSIHNEIVRCMDLSNTVIVLVSETFAESRHCRNEVEVAIQMDKPIILMIKDEIDTGRLPAMLCRLFDKYVRVLWFYENEEYVLKTSWENVSESILELGGNVNL